MPSFGRHRIALYHITSRDLRNLTASVYLLGQAIE